MSKSLVEMNDSENFDCDQKSILFSDHENLCDWDWVQLRLNVSTSNKNCEMLMFKSFYNTLKDVICYVHDIESLNVMSVMLMSKSLYIFCLVLKQMSDKIRKLDICSKEQLKSSSTCQHDEILILTDAAALLWAQLLRIVASKTNCVRDKSVIRDELYFLVSLKVDKSSTIETMSHDVTDVVEWVNRQELTEHADVSKHVKIILIVTNT